MITLSPRTKFLNSQYAKVHAELVLSDSFQQAIATTMLQVAYQEPRTNDPTVAAAAFQRLVGAHDFAYTLMNLCEVENDIKIHSNQNLPYQY